MSFSAARVIVLDFASFAFPSRLWVLGLLLSAAVPLALYASTMSWDVALEDDGLFLMNGVFLGVEHPPGYPVFTVVHHLFQHLPFGTAAFRGHLLSALFAASGCAVVFGLSRSLGAGWWPALAGAWLLGVSEHFWSQAVITEVYTFQVFLLLAALWSLVIAWRRPFLGWPLPVAAVFYGLSLGNNWPLSLLAAPGFLLALLTLWRVDPCACLRSLWWAVPLGCAAVVLPYSWLYWYASTDPFFSFAGPFCAPGQFFDFLLRRDYAGVDVHEAWTFSDFLGFSWWFLADLGRQTAYLGVVVALLGLFALFLAGQRFRFPYAARVIRFARGWGSGADVRTSAGVSASVQGCAFFWCSALLFCMHSFVLLAFLRNDYSDWQVLVFRPYPLLCYALLGVWFAIGLTVLLRWVGGFSLASGRFRGSTSFVAVAAAVAASVALVASVGAASWQVNDASGASFTRNYAVATLGDLPPDAVLVTDGDVDLFVLGYYHFVEGMRPDLILLSSFGHIFPSAVDRPNHQACAEMPMDANDAAAAWSSYVAAVGGPVYASLGVAFTHMNVSSDGHLAMRLWSAGLHGDPGFTELSTEFLERVVADRRLGVGGNGVDDVLRSTLRYYYGFRLAAWRLDGDSPADAEARLDALSDDYMVQLGALSLLVERAGASLYRVSVERQQTGPISVAESDDPPDFEYMDFLVARLLAMQGADEPVQARAEFLTMQGKIHLLRGRRDDAITMFALSRELYDSANSDGYMLNRWMGTQ